MSTRTSPYNQMSNYMSKRNPFPAVEYATLRFVRRQSISPSANGFSGFHSYRATSIFDPDYTNLTTGGQPYGHDTYAAIYHHYKVLSSTCTIAGNVSNNGDFPGFGIQCDDDATFSSETQAMLSHKGSTFVMQGSGGESKILKRSYNCSMLPDQSALCAEFGSNPEQNFFFRPFTMTDQANRSVDIVVTIVYKVKMWGLKGLSIS